MRLVAILSLLIIAGCSAPGEDGNHSATNVTVATPVPSEPVVQADGMLGGAPKTSRAAQAAVEVVDRYFLLIADKKYSEARRLWADDGAAAGGDDKAFAATISPYSIYRPKVGEPTEIKSTGGMQYVHVGADLHVKVRATGREQDRNGSVMLRRSADPKEPSAEKREWRIWGIDIRKRD